MNEQKTHARCGAMNTSDIIVEYNQLAEKVEKIIRETYDYHIESVGNMEMSDDDTIFVWYTYCCRGCHDGDSCSIPIKWLEHGFDYKTAFAELIEKQRMSAEKEAKAEAIRKEIEKEKRERKEYERLKKKFESEEKK